MDIGLVGVGDWGLKLAGAFRRNGHRVVAHAREQHGPAPGLGDLMPWERLIDVVDAVVCAAPPDTSLKVARACAAYGVPVFVTKPLMLTAPVELCAPFFVDYVRLWSPMWRRLVSTAFGRSVVLAQADVYGEGPERAFSSLLDYGSHALAFMHDLLGCDPIEVQRVDCVRAGTRLRLQVHGTIAGARVVVRTGNGWDHRKWCVRTYFDPAPESKNDLDSAAFDEVRDGDRRIARFENTHAVIAEVEHDPLGATVVDFCAAVTADTVTTRWAELAFAVAESLRKIQRACDSGR